MAISKITYTDKEALNIDTSVPEINKCQASDLNEIKSVVNNNADEEDGRLVNVGTSVDTDYRTNILSSKNLLDIDNLPFRNGYYSSTGQWTNANNNGTLEFIDVLPNTTYSISINISPDNITTTEFNNSTFIIRNIFRTSSGTNKASAFSTGKIVVGSNTNLSYDVALEDGVTPAIRFRQTYYNSTNNTINIGNGRQKSYNSTTGSANNSICIPYQIIGYK